MISLTVNGAVTRIETQVDPVQPVTLEAYVERLGLTGRRIAVERNGVIVKKPDYAATSLADGDVLEILHFVGGG